MGDGKTERPVAFVTCLSLIQSCNQTKATRRNVRTRGESLLSQDELAAKNPGGRQQAALAALGFSLWWAWVFLNVFNPQFALETELGDSPLKIIRTCSLASTVATLIFVFLIIRANVQPFKKPCLWVGAGALFLSTALFGFSGQLPSGQLVLMGVGSVIGGACLGYLSVAWCLTLSHFPTKKSQSSIILSFIFAIGIYFLASALPDTAKTLVASVFPVASTLLLVFFNGKGPLAQRSMPFADWEKSLRTFFLRLSLASAVSSLAFCLFRATLPFQTSHESALSSGLVFAIALPASIALLVLCLRSKEGIRLAALYHGALPIVVLGALALSVVEQPNVSIASAIIMAGTRCSTLLFWLLFMTIAIKFPQTKALVFCLGFSAMHCGALVGTALGDLVVSPASTSSLSLTSLSLGVILVMILSLGLLMSSKNPLEQRAKSIPGAIDTFAGIDGLAQAYKLSKREAEILAILAQGRTLPYVGEKLYIAPSTVSTHVKHIYKKLGVHNRQELLDFLEGYRNGEEADVSD